MSFSLLNYHSELQLKKKTVKRLHESKFLFLKKKTERNNVKKQFYLTFLERWVAPRLFWVMNIDIMIEMLRSSTNSDQILFFLARNNYDCLFSGEDTKAVRQAKAMLGSLFHFEIASPFPLFNLCGRLSTCTLVYISTLLRLYIYIYKNINCIQINMV